MNLRVLPFAAALMVPAAASGIMSTLVMRKLTEPKPYKSTQWVTLNYNMDPPIRVLSARL